MDDKDVDYQQENERDGEKRCVYMAHYIRWDE